MKYFIQTFGCQMNVADSNLFAGHLMSCGYEPTEKINEADIVVLNTCTVRQHAEDRALSYIGQLKILKHKNPELKIIVTGCVAELLGKNLKKQFPHIDLVIGAKDIENISEILKQSVKQVQDDKNTGLPHSPIQTGEFSMTTGNKVSAFVTIMRGCNNYCSYCVVPYVRGEEKSLKPGIIIDEIKNHVKNGIKEVTLLGQNVNSYMHEGTDFSDLLSEINRIEGLLRIRFMTNHPKDMSDKIIGTIASLDKVCEHVHLPLQSGSNRILELMNRKYTREHYYGIIEKLRSGIPGISITTDLMVGFPSETDEDFSDTLEMVERIGFDFSYVFKYSSRSKTRAGSLPDDISNETKQKRHHKLLELCNKIAAENNKNFLNKIVEVLIEKSYNNNVFTGKTRDNRTVSFSADKNHETLIGKLVNIEIADARIHALTGKIKH